MSQNTKTGNTKVQSTVDLYTCSILDKFAEIGVKGNNRAEVIAYILKNWVETKASEDLEEYKKLEELKKYNFNPTTTTKESGDDQ